MDTINLTPIVEAIIALCSALITTFLIPWIKSKATTANIEKVLAIVDVCVSSAEQIAERMGWNGEQKKEYVVRRLNDMGYALDDTINDYIEATVIGLHSQLKG